MQVKLRLLLADLEVPATACTIELEESSTIEDALTAYRGEYPFEDPNGLFLESMFIVDQNPASLETVLNDQDELLVMRILGGG